jgi:hypothetical protein
MLRIVRDTPSLSAAIPATRSDTPACAESGTYSTRDNGDYNQIYALGESETALGWRVKKVLRRGKLYYQQARVESLGIRYLK